MKKYLTAVIALMCVVSLVGGCKKKESKDEASDYVTLGEYNGLEISTASYEVTDDSLKQYVSEMISTSPSYKKTDKTVVENGDIVDINYEGLKDGVAFDGGTEDGRKLEIGSGSFIEGFEEQLVGAKVGDELAIDVTFPEEYQQSPDLAGQPVVFNVKINSIVVAEEITYDTLTDEYVSTNFGIENVDTFLETARTQLEQNNEYNKQVEIQNAVSEKLKSTSEVKEVPDSLMDAKVDEYIEQFTYMLKTQNNQELEEYLESNNNMTEEDFRKQASDLIGESLDLELILQAIAKKENIKIDEEEFNSYKSSMMSGYGIESEEEFLKQFSKEFLEEKFLENKAMELVTNNAKITETDANAAEEEATEDAAEEDTADGDTEEAE